MPKLLLSCLATLAAVASLIGTVGCAVETAESSEEAEPEAQQTCAEPAWSEPPFRWRTLQRAIQSNAWPA
jgi:hypothetical protein